MWLYSYIKLEVDKNAVLESMKGYYRLLFPKKYKQENFRF
jgi:hypothetical protein